LNEDGRRVLTVSKDGDVRLWDTSSGGLAQPALERHAGPVVDCAFSANGRLALFAFEDRTLRLWDTSSGEEITRWMHDTILTRCALSADGHIAVAGDFEGGIHFFDVVGVARTEGTPAAKLQ
jgi:WD40 repeat protein